MLRTTMQFDCRDDRQEIYHALNSIRQAHGNESTWEDLRDIYANFYKFEEIGRIGVGLLSHVGNSYVIYLYAEEYEDLEDILLLSLNFLEVCNNRFELFKNSAMVISSMNDIQT